MASNEEEEFPTNSANRSSVQDVLASLFSLQSADTPGGEGRTVSLSGITMQDLTRLLRGTGEIRRGDISLYEEDDDDENDDDDDDEDIFNRLRDRRPQRSSRILTHPPVTEPQKPGVDLLTSGEFGRVGNKLRSRGNRSNVARLLHDRLSKPMPSFYKEDIAQNLIPNSVGAAVAMYDANIYTGQYSSDSSFYYTCSQDFRLHVYDTKSLPTSNRRPERRYVSYDPGFQSSMKVMKTIQGHPGRWTITDANLSPDNQRMIYASITSTVYMTSTLDDSPLQIPIHFGDPPGSRRGAYWGYSEDFGIWSCRFSADGNEVVAGGSGKIFVYDLVANRRTVKISAHADDVNSCCWADTASGNVLVSASDDTFLKVWDRRSLGASQKPSGVLVGHTEGITYVSAKGDGRYVISNGKDQALRLWDLRKMRSSVEFDSFKDKFYGAPNYDYRYPNYPGSPHAAHPKDCSVMTYRGHAVLRTLIRCHFSPAETTGQQYIYSGSSDGKIHIWSLDGRIVQILDRSRTLPMSYDPSGMDPEPTNGPRHNVCVRDVSWHSQEPVIMSAGWESGRGGSIVARHEWKSLSKMHGRLEDWVDKRQQENQNLRRSERQREARGDHQRVPGAFEYEEEDE